MKRVSFERRRIARHYIVVGGLSADRARYFSFSSEFLAKHKNPQERRKASAMVHPRRKVLLSFPVGRKEGRKALLFTPVAKKGGR